MKNRKKIFIFVLLLCTIFSTLIIVKPNAKAVATTIPPSDLTGYTVIVPTNWRASAGYGFFKLNGTIVYASYNSVFNENLDYNLYIGYKYSYSNAIADNIYLRDIINGTANSSDLSNSISFTFSITGGTDATNQDLIQWLVNNNATFYNGTTPPSGYNVTLEQGSNSLDFSLFAVGEVLYQINESGYNVPIYTNEFPLPYTINDVESIQFINNSTDYRLLVYQDASTYYSIEPGNSSLLYSISADKTYDLELVRISSTPTTYTISGGYQFYPTISSSIFGDTSEQELDILLEGNFWLYDNDSVQWDMFTLHTLSSDDTALYFCYESSIFNKYNYVGQLINNNTQIQTYVAERTIYFEEQEVSEDVYNWLNDNGKFGNYDDTLPVPVPDNPFGFVVDMVNDFLQIEFLPGFKFIHLLYIAIGIPLLMYILKLFLGG